MRARVSGLTVGALMVFAATGNTQRSSKTVNYYPLQEGNTWNYQFAVGAKSMQDISATVTKVVPAAGGSEAQLEWRMNGKVMQVEVYRILPSELLRVKAGPGAGSTLSPPFPQIKYPLKPGQTWTWKGTVTTQGQAIPARSTVRVSGPAAIKTAAGTFRALHVHSELVVGQPGQSTMTVPNDYWFAPRVGLVAQKLPAGAQTLEGKLKSYKIK